jgi:hypothetical protein
MTMTARMTKAVTMAEISGCAAATAALYVPCHRVAANTLPPVLFWSYVNRADPDRMATTKAVPPWPVIFLKTQRG